MKHKVKMKKLRKFLLSSDEKEIIAFSYAKIKKGKLNRAFDLLNDIEPSNIAERFIKYKDLNTADLASIEKFIIICKKLYSNDKTIMTDMIYDQMLNKFKLYRDEPICDIIVSKRLVETSHEFPELKGNIEKANIFELKEKINSYDKSLETFFNKIFTAFPNRNIEFKASLKYDGVSGILTIDSNGYVEILLSRGEDNKGADMTHLTHHLRFDNVVRCGLKTEMIITEDNKQKYERERGKTYKNLRSAIVSIISSSDGAKYAKYISFVPLQSTITKPEQIKQINKLFANDVEYKAELFCSDNTKDAIKQMRIIVDKVLNNRSELGFDIDGVVIDVVDKDIREELGRRDDTINNFQIAYKFPPMSRLTKVRSVDITVGRTGLITPMVNYDDIYFSGAKHNKSTLSSYDRFMNLQFRVGETIRVTYNNDVMPYPNKYLGKENDGIESHRLLEFPKSCKCGSKLELRGSNYFCNNIECEYKIIPSYAWFYSSLGIPGMKEATIKTLMDNKIIVDYTDLINLNYNRILDLDGFGIKSVNEIKKNIDHLKNNTIDEAKLCSALGISGHKTCKELLSCVSLENLIENPNIIFQLQIEGFKDKKKQRIIDMLDYKKKEIKYFMKQLHVLPVKATDDTIKICFSGFRDKKIKSLLEALGVEVTDNVNKKTNYLVTKDNMETSKVRKAKKLGIPIISIPELLDLMKTIE